MAQDKTKLFRIVAILMVLLSAVIVSAFYIFPLGDLRQIVRVHDKLTCKDLGSEVEPLNDFTNYPCLGKDPNSPGGLLPAGCVRTVCREYGRWIFNSNTQFCVPLKNLKQNICTYDPKTDLVSEFIHKDGVWEQQLVDSLLNTLKQQPNLAFLDIGCNIGVYTLAAASLKTQTFCLDANQENLRLVSKSLSLGHTQDFVTTIWNALSDERGEVNFKLMKGNTGASRIGSIENTNLVIEKVVKTHAILLDDLIWLLEGYHFFMKIDVEGHQMEMLKGAQEFFKKVDVKYIQMEIYPSNPGNEIVDYMFNLGYLMFRDTEGKTILHKQDFHTPRWPGDVYFIKLSHLHTQ